MSEDSSIVFERPHKTKIYWNFAFLYLKKLY